MHSITGKIEGVKSRLWRGVAWRGVVAIAFGVVLLVWPRPSLVVMTCVLGLMAAADGALAIRTALTEAPTGERWWWGLAGVTGMATAVAVLACPDMTTRLLLYLVGGWALVMGALELAGAFFGPGGGRHGLALQGTISVAFGLIMLTRPGAGAVVLTSLIAAFAIARGVTLCGIARELHRGDDDVVTPSVPADAPASVV